MAALEDIRAMIDDAWRERLKIALEASGRSMRDVSIKAGKGKGYLHSILGEMKDPTIDYLIAVCNELGVSVSYILYGLDVTGEQEEILRLLREASPAAREGILQILRDKREQ